MLIFLVDCLLSLFGILWSVMPGSCHLWRIGCLLGSALWYALATILKAAAIHLEKNKPEPKEKEA